jgi:sec-independent protein translocase protein TatA
MTRTIPDNTILDNLERLMIQPLIGMPQGAEWLIILAIVVLVFGAAKLPELARGTGQALRIFKTETKGLRDDEDDKTAPPQTTTELPPTHTDTGRTDTSRVDPSHTDVTRTGTNDLPTEPRSDKHSG